MHKPAPVIALQQAPAALTAAPAHAATGPAARSLYIHTPFCVHKCHYCDFYSFVDTRGQQAAFVSRLVEELAAIAPRAATPLETVFVGGGTPSLLDVGLWRRLLGALGERFDLSRMGAAGGGEFTVECNPESTSSELLEALVGGGVNRVSIGAQSFIQRHLDTLERRHDPRNVGRAVAAARAAGIQRVSIDLIFAIPGQTLSDWRSDLEAALAIGLDHISCYNLTYEPNTAMTQRLQAGAFEPVNDETEAAMYVATATTLAAAGLDRYEVSNYARGGLRGPHASRHNLAYWQHAPWLAAGPSASGHLWADADPAAGSWRWKNVPRLDTYLASAGRGHCPAVDVEPPEPARALRERLMMGVRVADGVDAAAMLQHARALGPGVAERLSARVGALREQRLIAPREPGRALPERWHLSDAGWLMADHVAAELMAAVRG